MRTLEAEVHQAVFGFGIYVRTDYCQRHCCLFPMGKTRRMDTKDAVEKCPRFRGVTKYYDDPDLNDFRYAVGCAESKEEAVALEMMGNDL